MEKIYRIAAMLLLVWGTNAAYAGESSLPGQGMQPGRQRAILRNGFSLVHDHREIRGAVTRLYFSPSDETFVDVPNDQIAEFERLTAEEEAALAPAEPKPLPAVRPPAITKTQEEIILEAAGRHHLDADFIRSVIAAESGGNSRAVSRKGARGLMQLMPETASKLGVRNSFDAEANVDAGSRYLLQLLAMYHNDVPRALAAYNAGSHRVQQYHGVPPYRETRLYVRRIINDFNRRKSMTSTGKVAASSKTSLVAGQSSTAD